MRYCGNCGTPLDDRSIANRRCATCGTEIHSSGDVPYAGDGGTSALTTPAIFLNDPSADNPPPPWQVAPPPPSAVRQQGVPIGLAFVGGIITTLVLLALLITFLTRHPRTQSTTPILGQTGATATSQKAHPTPAPGATATTHPVTSTTPPASTTPGATATPATTTTPATTPASLSVQPQTDFPFAICLNRSMNFEVVNTGQNEMRFTLTNNTPYSVGPLNGTLDANEHQKITVSKMTSIGTSTIIVNAPGALNQPITVTIHCMS
ncbi:MAG: hypothetical protein H0X24_23915 [Ktedonobacterales bacterium]|nr:hypothetical protein [Ktedonobacterales bacterium]